MVIGLKKNVCQNPKCCESSTQDRWNKKLEAYESRKAYFKPEHKTSWGYCVENSGKKNQAQVKLAPEIFKSN